MKTAHFTLAALVLTSLLAASGLLPAAELKPGDPAPDFQLQGSDGKTHSLADYRSKQVVVIAWFPKAFTPGCTQENKSFRADGAKLKDFEIAYFTASADTADLNKKFAESLDLDYPILSDPEGKVARAYGVTGDQQKFPRRWTFYIGTDGKILAIDKSVRCPTHATDVAAKLQDLGVPKRK